MRKILLLILCAALMLIPVRAAEPVTAVALTFSGETSGYFTRQLLDGLRERGVKATFFLTGKGMEADPELTQRIFGEGHEIGLHSYDGQEMGAVSRRKIAADLAATRAQLPKGCKVRWFRPAGQIRDGLRQVAQVKKLAFLEWSVTGCQPGVIRDGDVVLLRGDTGSSVESALSLIDALQARGVRCVTAGELARLRGTQIQPGRVYRRFDREQRSAAYP